MIENKYMNKKEITICTHWLEIDLILEIANSAVEMYCLLSESAIVKC